MFIHFAVAGVKFVAKKDKLDFYIILYLESIGQAQVQQ